MANTSQSDLDKSLIYLELRTLSTATLKLIKYEIENETVRDVCDELISQRVID